MRFINGFTVLDGASEADLQQCDQLRVLLDKLDAAGSNAAELANYLRDEGVRGVRADAYQCAIAEYLNERLDEGYTVGVGGTVVLWHKSRRWAVAAALYGHTMSHFIRAFDKGMFPELERNGGSM